MNSFWLRCEKCSHRLDDTATEAVQFVAMFKPSLFPVVVPRANPKERRIRCQSCGFVNVFHPVTLTESWRDDIVPK